MEELLPKLLDEIRANLEQLRHDLRALDAEPVAFVAEYRREAYEAACLKGFRVEGVTGEMLHAFYRSLRVLSEGHPGFLDADPAQLERAYRITLEATIVMGEQVLRDLASRSQSQSQSQSQSRTPDPRYRE